MTEHPLYPITELEMRQIQNDCAFPYCNSCDGCPLADGEDKTRASGLGCNFKGANALIEEIVERFLPTPMTERQKPECEKYPHCNEECNLFWGCSNRYKREEREKVLNEVITILDRRETRHVQGDLHDEIESLRVTTAPRGVMSDER